MSEFDSTSQVEVSAGAAAPGAYEAPEGFAYDVYGVVKTVQDIDGSDVEIEEVYPDSPRRQSFLGTGERGNLVSLNADVQ